MRRLTRLARLREELRQRRYHREFRISPPMWTDPQRTRLEELLAAVRDAKPAEAGGAEDDAALATAATNLWRAQRKLTPPGERPSPRDRQASRYLRTCAEALADAGLVVQDHDGDAFNAGRALEVLVYQENPALTAETVIETVRPSVYLHGRLVQMGQVIVGTPDSRSDHA